MELAGMAPVTKNPDFMANAPNTTPDKETGIGAWTDTQIVIAIYEDRRPNGKIIGRPMPIRLCRDLSDRDVNAIVAYLRTVKLIRNVIPPSGYNIPPAARLRPAGQRRCGMCQNATNLPMALMSVEQT